MAKSKRERFVLHSHLPMDSSPDLTAFQYSMFHGQATAAGSPIYGSRQPGKRVPRLRLWRNVYRCPAVWLPHGSTLLVAGELAAAVRPWRGVRLAAVSPVHYRVRYRLGTVPKWYDPTRPDVPEIAAQRAATATDIAATPRCYEVRCPIVWDDSDAMHDATFTCGGTGRTHAVRLSDRLDETADAYTSSPGSVVLTPAAADVIRPHVRWPYLSLDPIAT